MPCLYLILNDLVGFGEPEKDADEDAELTFETELIAGKNSV